MGVPPVTSVPGLTMPLRTFLRLGFVWLACALGTPAAVASISMDSTPPEVEGTRLSESDRFARIDSLTVVYDDAPKSGRGLSAYRLGQLYLSTGLRKHRRLALDFLEEAVRLGYEPVAAAQLRAVTAQNMRYTSDASSWFESVVEEHDDPSGHVMLGRFYFTEAKRQLDDTLFRKAKHAFIAAAKIDSTLQDAWYGLALSLFALEEYASVNQVAPRLAEWDQTRAAGLFLEGAARAKTNYSHQAQPLFTAALATSSPEVRDVFLHGDGFLNSDNLPDQLMAQIDPTLLIAAMRQHKQGWIEGDDVEFDVALQDPSVRKIAVDLYWNWNNLHPTSAVNERRLRFWTRLVMADVLFGTDNHRGWQSEPGQTIVRWGRPDFMIYEPPSNGIDMEDWIHQGVRLSQSEIIPSQVALWVWTYRRDGNWFSLLFQDPTYQANWRTTSKTSENVRAMSRAQPLTFFDTKQEPRFRLAFRTASFPSARSTKVESYVAITPDSRFRASADSAQVERLASVEWAIFDENNERLEYVQRDVTARHYRSNLHAALGQPVPGGRNDPLLSQLGAALQPGQYRLALDVSGFDGSHRAAEVRLIIPSPVPPGLFVLSELQLASAFAPYHPSQDVPTEFVKYAYGIVPAPSAVYPSDASAVYVYFEAHNLLTGADGKTQFNVTYEVFRQRIGTSIGRGSRELTEKELAGIEPVGLTFVEESTGVSADGIVIKAGQVDIVALAPGRYVLKVEVVDLLSERVARRYVPFLKSRR